MAKRLVTEDARQDRVQYDRVCPRLRVRRREQLDRSLPEESCGLVQRLDVSEIV